MSFNRPVHSTSTCISSFPKIFGSTGTTNLYHIDVFNDYLALAGYTAASTLTGTTSIIPYLALTSISTGDKYYWVKALTLKQNNYFNGVKFSTDGALLIAHSRDPSSNYIVVFNVSSGNILSARSYSAGGRSNYSYRIRSMTVSSGASPMAYVLSNY